MAEFNIKIDNLELRDCKDDDTILAEIVLNSKSGNPYVLAEWKVDRNGFQLNTIPTQFEDGEEFNALNFVNLLKLMISVVEKLFLEKDEVILLEDENGNSLIEKLEESFGLLDDEENDEEDKDETEEE